MSSKDSGEADLRPGARLGPYEIEDKVGAGGMGEVYRAHDTRLGRRVAVKVLPPWFSSDPDRLRRFEQEARAIAALDHPNVLVVHDVGSHQGSEYLVTELLQGESLGERLGQGPLPVRKAVEIAIQIARGLAAAHDQGIVHRDVKPANVFLTDDGRVKVLDFGLAKLGNPLDAAQEAETLTSPGTILGTVGYLSPEQARGRPADERSDVFALGAVLYEMLTGRRAFQGDSTVGTLAAILNEDPPEMRAATGLVPPAIERVVRRCLEKQPAERFQSARDLGFALEALDLDSGLSAGKAPAAPRLRSLPVSFPWSGSSLVRALALLVLGGLVAGLGGRWLAPPAPPRVTAARPLMGGIPGKPVTWVTDGERVYFTVEQDEGWRTYQVPMAGGEPTLVPMPTESSMICDVSRRHSALLVIGWDGVNNWSADLPVWIIPVPAGSPKRLGIEAFWAGWSPDGDRIAFTGGSQDYSKQRPAVFVAQADGSEARRLWEVPDGYARSARWSRDGRTLSVQYQDESTGEWWLAEMPADGSAPPERVMPTRHGSWTPDHRYLVYEEPLVEAGSKSEGLSRLSVWPQPGVSSLWRRGPSTALTVGPLSFYGPRLSPDGRQILAGGSLTRTETLMYDREEARFVRAPGGPNRSFIDYSPDGRWMAWVDVSTRVLWRARSDGSERLQITLPPLEVGPVRWSPDGSRLAFAGGPDGDRPEAIYVVPRDGGAAEAVSPPGDRPLWDPCWLPDGGTLVWGHIGWEGPITSLDLETGRTSVLRGSELMLGPKCSPTGAVLAAKEWVKGWWLFDPETGTWEDLGPETVRVPLGYPRWSRDGRAIYGLSTTERAVMRFDLASRTLEVLADLQPIEEGPASVQGWMGLGPGDAPLVLRESGMWDLYVLDWQQP
jgi:Tol biopolymer transport system component